MCTRFKAKSLTLGLNKALKPHGEGKIVKIVRNALLMGDFNAGMILA